jgi:hypothetical protein
MRRQIQRLQDVVQRYANDGHQVLEDGVVLAQVVGEFLN